MITDPAVDLSPWAKTRMGGQFVHPLLFHLLDSGLVALVLWDEFLAENQRQVIASGLGLSQEQARAWVAFCAGLHDLGKLTPSFQECAGPGVYQGVSARLRADAGVPKRFRHE